ncbi:Uncharacterized protein OBRU01_14419, partial [Operophtera brumata]
RSSVADTHAICSSDDGKYYKIHCTWWHNSWASIVNTVCTLGQWLGITCQDSSRLTCSPFSSPLHDITNDLNKSSLHDSKERKDTEVIDLSNVEYYPVRSKVLNKLANSSIVKKENVYDDDDVAIIETKTEIIALSSDDDDDVNTPTAQDIANDGFEKGLSWEDIQKASNAVQPRMFGKQGARLPPLGRHHGDCPPHHILGADAASAARPSLAQVAGDPETLRRDTRHHGDCPPHHILGADAASAARPSLAQVAGDPETLRRDTSLHHGAARPTQPHRLATYDLVATTYNILQRDCEKNGVLMRVQWRRVILDEAHIVRNHKSATSAAVCGLRARRRWCLTGTPVQNKDLDLFALLKFIRCSPFDELQRATSASVCGLRARRRWCLTDSPVQNKDLDLFALLKFIRCSPFEELQMWKKWINNKSAGGQERLSTIMHCILLRRTKVQLQQMGQLACLPARTPHLTEVTLSQQEMNVYQKRAEKNADSTSFAAKQQDSEYYKMHKRMMALQVLSPNNPVFELTRPSSKIQAVMDCLNTIFTNKGTTTPCSSSHDPPPRYKPSWTALTLYSPTKAVVVSQWTSVLRLVETELKKQRIRSVTLSGNVPVPTRPALIDAVNDPKSDVKTSIVESELKKQRIRSVTLSGNVPVPTRPALIDAVNDPKSDVKTSIVESELKKQRIRSVTLSGSVPVPTRPALIDAVNDPKSDVQTSIVESELKKQRIRSVPVPTRPALIYTVNDPKTISCLYTSIVESELKKQRIRSVTLSGSLPVPTRPALIDAVNDPKSDVKVLYSP